MNGRTQLTSGASRRGRLARRLDAARRDLGMLFRTLTGATAPALVRENTREGYAASEARIVTVTEVAHETADAVRLHLRATPPLEWEAGQFLTLHVEVDGVRHRRAYSIASPPGEEGDPCVVVKRVPGGVVSSRLLDEARVGQRFVFRGPSGRFLVPAEAAPGAHHVLIGGGSGVTPLMAIARTLLRDRPEARVTVLYGSRRPEDIIFRDALRALAARHERLSLRLVVEEGEGDDVGAIGRLDAALLARELGAAHRDDAWYYVSGPEAMLDAARAYLRAAGVPDGRVLEERFVSLATERLTAADIAPAPATIRAGSAEVTTLVPRGASILDAGLRAGAAMPFSCTMGGCGACRVRLVSGDVVLDAPNCLTDEERDDGWILTCVAHPVGPVVVEVEAP